MRINLRFKSLIVVLLLSSCSSSAKVQIKENIKNTDHLAPEVSVAETKLTFWKIPNLKKAFITTSPTDRKDGIPVDELNTNDRNKDDIVKLAEDIAKNKYGKYDGLLISHKDKLLFESYFNKGRVDLPHFQASGTKIYTSLAIGRAIELGYMTMDDLNKPVISFFKDLKHDKLTKGVEHITLHQSMTMRSGVRVSDEARKQIIDNNLKVKGSSIIQELLENSVAVTPESQTFKYQFDPLFAMHVLENVVPGSAMNFIKNEVFAKLGITNYSWKVDVNGVPLGGSGSNLTARDMIKLGRLIINNGNWNGEQLISEAFLNVATSGVTKAAADWHPENSFYGYYWYQTEMKVGNKSYSVSLSWGAGGNRIITVKDLDLIIVITGHDREDAKILDQISKCILPAFVNKF